MLRPFSARFNGLTERLKLFGKDVKTPFIFQLSSSPTGLCKEFLELLIQNNLVNYKLPCSFKSKTAHFASMLFR